MHRRLILLTLLLAGLGGCATPGSHGPQHAGPSLAQARTTSDLATLPSRTVRWGGTIARVDNRPDSTLIEIVEQPLGSGGRPRDENRSQGRFLARFEAFLDPVIYAAGKTITVNGTITDTEPGQIGARPYRFVVVDADNHTLWPQQLPPRVIYYYDPWYFYPHFYGRYSRRWW